MSEETRNGQKRHAFLVDIVEIATHHLSEHEIPPAVVITAANALADRMSDYWGGQVIAFPRDYVWKLAKLELEIYDQFTGQNHDVLARKYSMTVRGIRKLIARVRAKLAKQRNHNQRDLLDGNA